MLSPGERYKLVPRNLQANLKYRRRVLSLAGSDPEVRQTLVALCRADIVFYVNTFVWQFNPKRKIKSAPFVTWEFQDRAMFDILWAVEHGRDLVIEKSREMGASWMCLLVMDWLARFHDGYQFLLLSRSAEAVESKSPDSLFWKLEFINDHLPDWLKDGVEHSKMYMGYSRTHSHIAGQATTGKAGVGGRASAIFLDEFSQVDEDREILGRTADVSDCRIFNFTHKGLNTAAYDLTQRPDVKKLRLMWWDHPVKARGLYQWNAETRRLEVRDTTYQYPRDFVYIQDGKLRSPWYDDQCLRRSARDVAMDLDCDPKGSLKQYFNAMTIKLLQRECQPPWWEGDVQFDPDTGRDPVLVEQKGGPLRLWCHLPGGRPHPGKYAFGADISNGQNATPSCLSGIYVGSDDPADRRGGLKVMEYVSNTIEPQPFAVLCVALCWLFKTPDGQGAKFAWEMQGPGYSFGKKMVELKYTNIHWRKAEHAAQQKTRRTYPGWYSNPNNKRVLIGDYKAAIQTRQMVNPSWAALEECLAFEDTGNGPEHGGGKVVEDGQARQSDDEDVGDNHGDRVVADALAWKMCKEYGWASNQTAAVNSTPATHPGTLAWRRDFHERLEAANNDWY